MTNLPLALDAVADARRLVANAPRLPAVWLTLFSILHEAGDHAAAHQVLTEGARKCSHDNALTILSQTYQPPEFSDDGQREGEHSTGDPSLFDDILVANKDPDPPQTPHADVDVKNARPVSNDPSHTAVKHQSPRDTTNALSLRLADDALQLGRFDHAIATYTAILSSVSNQQPSHITIQALSHRSKAHLQKAIAQDDPDSYGRAVNDAQQVVALSPEWHEAWLRLGSAHLENGCPGRAKDAYRRGLKACGDVEALRDGIRDCHFVIEREGVESDWEDHENDTEDETFTDALDGSDRTPSASKSSHPEEEHGQEEEQRAEHFERVQSEKLLQAQQEREDARARQAQREEENLREQAHRQREFERQREQERLRELDNRSLNSSNASRGDSSAGRQYSDSRNALSSRFRFSRQVSRNAAVERLGQGNPSLNPNFRRKKSNTAQVFNNLSDSLSSPLLQTPTRPPPIVRNKSSGRALPSAAHGIGQPHTGNSSSHSAFDGRQADMSNSSASLANSQLKLYELLQVPKDASEAAIKKSYYQLARKYHPDKNAHDPDATLKFQQLAEAYRVLSDPESRAVYDRYGDRGLVKNSVDMIDPSTLFAMVFGSDQFVHLVGELQLASLATQVDDNGNTPSEDVLNSIQKARVGKLVLEMVKLLKPWVDGDKRGFLSSIHRMMRRLRDASFGPSLLCTVGNAYVQQVTHLLDKSRPFNLSAVMRKASLRSHKIVSHHKAMSAAGRVMDKQRKLHDRVMRSGRDNRYISEGEAKQIAVEMAENAIDMMWKISIIDIETTLEDVLLIVLSGRDLIAEGDMFLPQEPTSDSFPGTERSRYRRRLGSYLGKEARTDRSREGHERLEGSLVRPVAPLSHGQPAVTREQILSERAYGIQAMGRILMSAGR